MENCAICGKENANNLTWSEEWLCNVCVAWADNLPFDIYEQEEKENA